MSVGYNEWFRVGGVDLRWLPKSPPDSAARCDRKWNHIVPAGAPRLQADTQTGPLRRRGKGKRHEYLCVQCAYEVFSIRPPSVVWENQEKLF